MPRNKKKKRSPSVTTDRIFSAQVLLCLNAALWFGFGIFIIYDMVLSHNRFFTIFLIFIFFLINMGGMILSAVMLPKRETWAYYLPFVILIANAVFTRFGQFEVFDMVTFIFDLLVVLYLISIYKAYFRSK